MATKYLLSTTGTQDPVVLPDLSGISFAHPTINFDLLSMFSTAKVVASVDLQVAMDAGEVTLVDENFDPVSSAEISASIVGTTGTKAEFSASVTDGTIIYVGDGAEIKAAYELETNAYTDAKDSKLAGIEGGATGDQTGAEIKIAYEAETNAYTDTKDTKLAGIEAGATADQTGAEIKTAYEAEANAYTDAKNTKLAGIETNATADQTGAEIKAAYELEANAYTDAKDTKLTNIETGATADQTGAEIKTAYELETNAYTDTKDTKLTGIEALADVTDSTNVNAAGATMNADTDLSSNSYFKNDSTFATPDATKVASELAVKIYVDANIAGVPAKENAHVATTTYLDNLGVGVWAKAGSKVTKTLTAANVGILTIDGIATALGDRIYVKNEDGSSTNLTDIDQGMYDVTTEGTAGVAAILTRSDDFNGDPAGEVKNGVYAYVTIGTANSNTGWRVLSAGIVDVDVDSMPITQFQGVPGNHAPSHTDGTDDIQSATNTQKGLATAAHITAVEANTAKTSNATHTGDVTGVTALSIDKTAITGKGAVTAAVGDYILATDGSDSDNLKKIDLGDLMGGGGDMLALTYDPNTVNGDAFSMDNMAEGANTKIMTGTERTNLGNQTGTNTGDEASATITSEGIVELATIAETDAGTATDRAVTPASLVTIQGDVDDNTLKDTNVTTNLSTSQTATTVDVASSDGTDATLPQAIALGNAGVMSGVDKNKLDGIESGATADQTGAEIKTAYELETNTNAFTDGEQTKLANQSGVNTGDQSTIVGITGTKTQFDTALTDGDFLYVGDIGASLQQLHIRDERASGTDGGASLGGAQNVRVLNTVVTNTISGASLSSNQITLPAGTYRITANAPVYRTDEHKIRLRNITDATTAAVGTSGFSKDGTNSDMVMSVMTDYRFTITATKVFELQHYTENAHATTGLGRATTSGDVEVYADIVITKE